MLNQIYMITSQLPTWYIEARDWYLYFWINLSSCAYCRLGPSGFWTAFSALLKYGTLVRRFRLLSFCSTTSLPSFLHLQGPPNAPRHNLWWCQTPIFGCGWRCNTCVNFHLCGACYIKVPRDVNEPPTPHCADHAMVAVDSQQLEIGSVNSGYINCNNPSCF